MLYALATLEIETPRPTQPRHDSAHARRARGQDPEFAPAPPAMPHRLRAVQESIQLHPATQRWVTAPGSRPSWPDAGAPRDRAPPPAPLLIQSFQATAPALRVDSQARPPAPPTAESDAGCEQLRPRHLPHHMQRRPRHARRCPAHHPRHCPASNARCRAASRARPRAAPREPRPPPPRPLPILPAPHAHCIQTLAPDAWQWHVTKPAHLPRTIPPHGNATPRAHRHPSVPFVPRDPRALLHAAEMPVMHPGSTPHALDRQHHAHDASPIRRSEIAPRFARTR